MIIAAQTAAWITIAILLISLLPTEPELPSEVAGAISWLFAGMNAWANVFPVVAYLTIITLIFTIDLIIVGYKAVEKVFHMIKG